MRGLTNALSGMLKKLRTDLGNPSSASGVTGADAFSKIATLNADLSDKCGVAEFYHDPYQWYEFDHRFDWTEAKIQAICDKMASALGAGNHVGMCFFQNGGLFVGTYTAYISSPRYIGISLQTYSSGSCVHFGEDGNVPFFTRFLTTTS